MADGKRDEAMKKYVDAQSFAEEAYKTVVDAYDKGRVSYDFLRSEANRMAEIKLKVARLKRENSQTSTSPTPNTAESPASSTATPLTPTNTFSPVSRFPWEKGIIAESPNMPYRWPSQQLPSERSLLASPATPASISTAPPAAGISNAPSVPNDDAVVVEQRLAPDGRPVYESRAVPKDSAGPSNRYSSVPARASTDTWAPISPVIAPATPANRPESPVTPLDSPANSSSNSNTSAADSKSALRYDGRTFEEWRKAWLTQQTQSELAALEAFAGAGYAHEANSAILVGAFSNSVDANIGRWTRKYLSTLSHSQAEPIVSGLIRVLQTDLDPNRRINAMRALAAIGPNADAALDILKKVLANNDVRERVVAATAIKMIVGKDQYQKPIADVLGKELGINVVKDGSGAWAALPREDSPNADAFNKFTNDVIKEQELLFPRAK
jgi:hypothetical protein